MVIGNLLWVALKRQIGPPYVGLKTCPLRTAVPLLRRASSADLPVRKAPSRNARHGRPAIRASGYRDVRPRRKWSGRGWHWAQARGDQFSGTFEAARD